jgi:hypothetical protein
MEMSQENSLYSYLKQTNIIILFFKIKEQEVRISPVWGLVPVGGEKRWGKGV